VKIIGTVESFGNCYIIFLKVCVLMTDLYSTPSIIFIRLDENNDSSSLLRFGVKANPD